MSSEVQTLHDRILAALASNDPNVLKSAVTDVRSADIAEVLNLLDDDVRSRVIYALPSRTAAEVIVMLSEVARGEVVEDMDEGKLTQLVTELPPDDAADVLAELPEEQSEDVLEQIADARSEQIETLMSYAETSAGGIMNPELLAVPASATIAATIERVRTFGTHEDIHFVYVVDDGRKLVGTLPLRRLVMHDPQTRLETICDDDPVTVNVDEDQEVVVHIMRKYDVAAVAVVDPARRLLGRITYDDVMDVAEEEAAEDLYRMAGTDAAELETTSPLRAASVRMVWLTPCLFGTGLAAVVLAASHSVGFSVTQIQALILFVPAIAAMSGNAGIQTSTIIQHGFATGELAASMLKRVFLREAKIALAVAFACGLLGGGMAGIGLFGLKTIDMEVAMAADVLPVQIGLAVGLGMFCAIIEAGGLGIALPFIFRRIGVDPAIASGPLITTINDGVSVTIYLLISLAILT